MRALRLIFINCKRQIEYEALKEKFPNAQKKDLIENPPDSKIKSYFKAAPKQFVVEKKIENAAIQSDNNKDVYIQALKDKLKSKVICTLFSVNVRT